MPKRIVDELRARAVRLVKDHQGEYSSLTAAAAVVAKQLRVGKESVRRRVIQSQVDGGQRSGATSEELAEIQALKARVRRLEDDNAIVKSATVSSPGNSTPATADHGVHDTMRSQGHAVESICRVLREQDCQIAARTYRAWKHVGRTVAPRTLSDAHVVDAVREAAWTSKVDAGGLVVCKPSPEGLYGRRKMTAYLRRTTAPNADRRERSASS